MIIRKITAEDEAAWRPLWRGYLAYYETELPETVFRSTFDRMLAGNAGAESEFRGLICEDEGEALGLVHFLFHRHGWKIENVCYLQDLYTVPEARGRGVGRALVEAVYAEADLADRPSVYWLTQHFNTEGRRLYDKIGTLTPFIKYVRS